MTPSLFHVGDRVVIVRPRVDYAEWPPVGLVGTIDKVDRVLNTALGAFHDASRYRVAFVRPDETHPHPGAYAWARPDEISLVAPS